MRRLQPSTVNDLEWIVEADFGPLGVITLDTLRCSAIVQRGFARAERHSKCAANPIDDRSSRVNALATEYGFLLLPKLAAIRHQPS
jgi:hypothetical protein